jgi:signal transduction histidine kinase
VTRRSHGLIQNAAIARNEQPSADASAHARETLRRAQELDRARIAQTIHDHFGFLLMLLRMRLQRAKGYINSLPGDEPTSASRDAALTELTVADTVWQQLSNAARQLQNDLHPAPLDGHGLAAALAALRRTFAGAGLTVMLNADALSDQRFSVKLETTAYWLTQHALTNVLRHSGTNEATVTADIVRTRGREVLHIVIEDRGKGFTVGQIGSTFGLTAMYDRAALIGGTVAIDSTPGHGTRVTVHLPTDFESSDDERDPEHAERD